MGDLAPSAAALGRATALAGPAATVREIRALPGGTHAHTYLIRTANPAFECILREFPPGDQAPANEARVLPILAGLDGLVPRLLASGAGEQAPRPGGEPGRGGWTLISRLPGTADIIPVRPAAWAEQLGQALARIHAVPRHSLGGLRPAWDGSGWDGAAPVLALHGQAAGLVSARWEALASAQAVLTHRDFWSGNTLWQDGALTGVVDWSGGVLGPRGIDVSWCRLDLYLLYGEQIAAAFTDSYQRASKSVLADLRYWDLWSVAYSAASVESWEPNYRDLGRTDLTARELRARHTAWTRHLIQALT